MPLYEIKDDVSLVPFGRLGSDEVYEEEIERLFCENPEAFAAIRFSS